MVRLGHQIETHIGPREVVDGQVSSLEQEVHVGGVGDLLAIEFDAHASRRGLECDLVVGIRLEPGFSLLPRHRHDRVLLVGCPRMVPTGGRRKATIALFNMEAKSVITFPSGKMNPPEPGFYEITGLADAGDPGLRHPRFATQRLTIFPLRGISASPKKLESIT